MKPPLPLPLLAIAVLFVGVLAFIVISALAPRHVLTYEPRPWRPAGPGAVDTVTLDARDPEAWRYFNFTRGPLTPPDTAAWDLRVQRFHVVAWKTDDLDSPSDLGRWYRYSVFSHLLVPKPGGYAIRARDGGEVRLEFLSYYCPGPEAGCVTFRYARRR